MHLPKHPKRKMAPHFSQCAKNGNILLQPKNYTAKITQKMTISLKIQNPQISVNTKLRLSDFNA